MKYIQTIKIQHIVVVLMLLFVSQWAQAQSFMAAGTVLDDHQEPLIGANVKVVNGTGGSVTDMDGHFKVACSAGALLDISYVGYVTQRVKAGKDMRVMLVEDAKTLAETTVVGVGYGTMRKSDLTGAITSVNAKDMRKGVITSTEQLLQVR